MPGKRSPSQHPIALKGTGANMPPDYRIAETMEQLLQNASRESVRRLMWQMERGPTLIAKERAATMLAKIAVSRPPQRVELTGKDGGAVELSYAETLRKRREERVAKADQPAA